MNARDRTDYAFLAENARLGRTLGLPCFAHLDQPIGVWAYIRIANDLTRQWCGYIPGNKGQEACAVSLSQPRLLDWGCGYGQMSYLLAQRGFLVTPFDVGPVDAPMPDIPLCRDLPIVRVQEPTRIPFAAATFDVVLACGVLEHVAESNPAGNERASLCELARVLRPRGRLFIYQLPQRYAWQEALIRRLRLGYAHPRRYTASEVRGLLGEAGLRVQRLQRANLFPRNLTGMPSWLRTAYSRLGRALIVLDGWLCHLPLLNQLAGVLEIAAEKEA